jgi:hypothetical protein
MGSTRRIAPRLVALGAIFWIGTPHAAEHPAGECAPEAQNRIYGQLFSSDQDLRKRYTDLHAGHDEAQLARLGQEILEQDAKNQAVLDTVVGTCGWPRSATFVNSNLETAFLVIQHAPLATMLRYKDRVEQSHTAGEIPQSVMQLFYDRLEYRKAEQKQAVPHG